MKPSSTCTRMLRLAVGMLGRCGVRPRPGALRIATFHSVPREHLGRLRTLLERLRRRFVPASAGEIEGLAAGTWTPGRPCLAITFDDGFADGIEAAEIVREIGFRAIYFVVPSFVGRSMDEFLAYNRRRGVTAFDFSDPGGSRRGFSRADLRLLLSMGHTIGCHPMAHRNLAALDADGLAYDIDGAKAEIEDLVGGAVEHFSFSHGHASHLSVEADARIRSLFRHVYAGVRGSNASPPDPFFWRDACDLKHPRPFLEFCIAGGCDRWWRHERESLLAIAARSADPRRAAAFTPEAATPGSRPTRPGGA